MKNWMLLLIFLFSVENLWAQNLSITENSGCVLTEGGVKCWGNLPNPEDVGLKLKSHTQIEVASVFSSNTDLACALDIDGVKCWRVEGIALLIPELQARLKRPKKLFKSKGSIVVLDDSGLFFVEVQLTKKDVGYYSEPQFFDYFAQFDHPYIAAGTCAFDRKGYACLNDSYSNSEKPLDYDNSFTSETKGVWNFQVGHKIKCIQDTFGAYCEGGRETEVPGHLKNLGPITVGSNHACAIAGDKVECWGAGEHFPASYVAVQVVGPREVDAVEDTTCVLDSEGVKCWGPQWRFETLTFEYKNPQWAEAYHNSLCVLDEGKARCKLIPEWDGRTDDWGFREDPTGATNIKVLEFGHGSNCWETDKGVTCTGREDMPKDLKNVEKFALGKDFGCALAKGKLTCWGDGSVVKVPEDLGKVLDISAASEFACAITDSGVKCWGDYRDAEWHSLQAPNHLLPHPTFIKTHSLAETCVISAPNIVCWGKTNLHRENADEPRVYNLGLKAPKALFIGFASYTRNYYCALDGEELKCAGDADFISNLPQIKRQVPKPIGIMASQNILCFINKGELNNNLKCFNPIDISNDESFSLGLYKFNELLEINWEQLGGTYFNLVSLEKRLKDIKFQLPILSAWVVENLATFVEREMKSCYQSDFVRQTRPECRSQFRNPRGHGVMASKILVLELLGPILYGMDSDTFKSKILPDYERTLADIKSFLRSEGVDYNLVPRTPLEKKTALKLLELELRACVQLLTADKAAKVMELAKLVAVAGTKPDDRAALVQLLNTLRAKKSVLESLKNDLKWDFFYQSIELNLNWLNKSLEVPR